MSAAQSGGPGDRRSAEGFPAGGSCTTSVAHQAEVPAASLQPLCPLCIACLFEVENKATKLKSGMFGISI